MSFAFRHERRVGLGEEFVVNYDGFFNEVAVYIVLADLKFHSEKLLTDVVGEFENDVLFFGALVFEHYVFLQGDYAVGRGVLDFSILLYELIFKGTSVSYFCVTAPETERGYKIAYKSEREACAYYRVV